MENLLQDAYDLHVHTGPDINPRKATDIEMVSRYKAIGIKGFCIKSHYFSTAGRARHIKELYPDFNCIGALVLNSSVGGLNPDAVLMAALEGAKLLWFPTFDAKNEIDFTFSDRCTYEVLPGWVRVLNEKKAHGRDVSGITIFDENGKIKEEVKTILDLASEKDMVVCTGHLSKPEGYALIKEAKGHSLKKPVVVTHATFCSEAYTKEEQKELAEMGAIIEECFGAVTVPYGMTWPGMYEIIRYVGPEHIIMSSDLGHPKKDYPDVGMQQFAENLLNNGFTVEEIRRMAVINTAMLVE